MLVRGIALLRTFRSSAHLVALAEAGALLLLR
jgi:hypothetical protein